MDFSEIYCHVDNFLKELDELLSNVVYEKN